MKNEHKPDNKKMPIVTINPALDKYRDQVMFPEKLAQANQMLMTAKLPAKKTRNTH